MATAALHPISHLTLCDSMSSHGRTSGDCPTNTQVNTVVWRERRGTWHDDDSISKDNWMSQQAAAIGPPRRPRRHDNAEVATKQAEDRVN